MYLPWGTSGHDIINKTYKLKNTNFYAVLHRNMYTGIWNKKTKTETKDNCKKFCIHPVPLLLAEIEHFDLFESDNRHKTAIIQRKNKIYRIVAADKYENMSPRYDGITWTEITEEKFGKLKMLIKVQNFQMAIVQLGLIVNSENVLNCTEIELKSALFPFDTTHTVLFLHEISNSVHLAKLEKRIRKLFC